MSEKEFKLHFHWHIGGRDGGGLASGADENIPLASFQEQEQLPCARSMCRITGCGEANANITIASFQEQEQHSVREGCVVELRGARC